MNRATEKTLKSPGPSADNKDMTKSNTPGATTMDSAGTTRIEGRDYTIETSNEPSFTTVMSKYGEVILHGARGARYTSERYHGTHVLRFWNDRVRSLPGIMFDRQSFVIEEGNQGHEITLRPATYREAVDAYETMNAASRQRGLNA